MYEMKIKLFTAPVSLFNCYTLYTVFSAIYSLLKQDYSRRAAKLRFVSQLAPDNRNHRLNFPYS